MSEDQIHVRTMVRIYGFGCLPNLCVENVKCSSNRFISIIDYVSKIE